MEFRRLVVWISAGILAFQGVTLALDLLNCTLLSWLFVQRYGFSLPTTARTLPMPSMTQVLVPPQAPRLPSVAIDPFASLPEAGHLPPLPPPAPPLTTPLPRGDDVAMASPETPQRLPLVDPMALLCQRPQSRVDTAASQGLSILAGLVLGGSLGAAATGTAGCGSGQLGPAPGNGGGRDDERP